MIYFEWGVRSADNASIAGEPEVSFIIFPDEARFRLLPQPGPRAFELVFEDTTRPPYFFWAQEPRAETDAANAATFHDAINRPVPEDDLDDDPSAMPGVVEPPPALAAPVPKTTSQPQLQAPTRGNLIDPDLFRMLMDNVSRVGAGAGAGPGKRPRMMLPVARGPGLTDIFKIEVLRELFRDPAIQPRLMEHLPAEHRSTFQLMELAESPQLQAQLSNLSHALETGEVDPRQFGVDAAGPGVRAFLEALDRAGAAEQKKGRGTEGPEGGAGPAGGTGAPPQ